MLKHTPASLEVLTIEIRRAFQSLRSLTDELHRDLGITAGMRAVMELLADGTSRTVPEIARSKNVTRQHIQQIINALQPLGFVEVSSNPRHQASPLLSLTPSGVKVMTEMRQREAVLFARLTEGQDERRLNDAADLLRDLVAQMEKLNR